MQKEPSTPPAVEQRRSLVAHVRTTLLTGVALVLPLIVTVWLFIAVVGPLDHFLQPLFDRVFGRRLPGLGFLTLLVFLYVIGLVGRNVAGRMVFGALERLFLRIPVARSVYNAIKELSSAFALDGSRSTFREVCMVEYPRPGILAMGFVTSRVRIADDHGEREMVTVFIPHPPNPASGVFVAVPVEQVFTARMTVEEGLKMVLSSGIVAPAVVRLQSSTRDRA
jgi:uncharacterized membrane protein